jgi:hypothetical protein
VTLPSATVPLVSRGAGELGPAGIGAGATRPALPAWLRIVGRRHRRDHADIWIVRYWPLSPEAEPYRSKTLVRAIDRTFGSVVLITVVVV